MALAALPLAPGSHQNTAISALPATQFNTQLVKAYLQPLTLMPTARAFQLQFALFTLQQLNGDRVGVTPFVFALGSRRSIPSVIISFSNGF